MTGYSRPVTAPISDTFAGHLDRDPPSTEPGVDYACRAGIPVLAPADGFVVGIDRDPAGAAGRAIMIKTGADYHRGLHLLRVDLVPGQRFRRGQQLALSGASAHGSEWGVGPHLHWSFWRAPGGVPVPGVTRPQNFELYVGAPAGGGAVPLPIPSEEDDIMCKAIGHYIGGDASTPADKRVCLIYYPVSGFYELFGGVDQTYINDQARAHNTGNFTHVTQNHFNTQIRPKLDALLAKG
jgi:murein DD-endopeptidase MepM/ murein hydrolase activator NlpD